MGPEGPQGPAGADGGGGEDPGEFELNEKYEGADTGVVVDGGPYVVLVPAGFEVFFAVNLSQFQNVGAVVEVVDSPATNVGIYLYDGYGLQGPPDTYLNGIPEVGGAIGGMLQFNPLETGIYFFSVYNFNELDCNVSITIAPQVQES